jgi:AcrR family transcriptional regulator
MTSVDGRGASHEHVVRDQRARIMRALTEILAERGFAGATVGLVVGRARVSTRTFYQCFDGLEECLIAIMDSVLEQAVALASGELQGAESWQDGVRSALAAVLSYFDREPELARVSIVETLAGGPVVLAHRERLIEAFRLPVLQRIEREVPNVSPLTAEGVMSSVLGIMHAHIVTAKPGPFIELLGPLMGLIMAPYLGALGLQREIEQGDELAQAILNGDSRWFPPEVRRVIYTTNAIEALNRQLRKAVKTKGHFPTEDAARKLIYLAIQNAVPQWTRTRGWTKALLAFKIHFGDRLPD